MSPRVAGLVAACSVAASMPGSQDLDTRDAVAPFEYAPHQLITIPPVVPAMGVLNHATVAAFNEVWFRRAPARRTGEIQDIGAFFHPLDLIGCWNRLYGSRGMVQYQFVVPFGEEEALRTVVERLSASGAASFLAVLKRFGAREPGAAQLPAGRMDTGPGCAGRVTHGLGDLLHGLDRVVLDAGGRHYFAKDSHMTPEAVRRGYPRLEEWRAIRDGGRPESRVAERSRPPAGLIDTTAPDR